MATKDDIAWFKANFLDEMAAAVKDTSLTVARSRASPGAR